MLDLEIKPANSRTQDEIATSYQLKMIFSLAEISKVSYLEMNSGWNYGLSVVKTVDPAELKDLIGQLFLMLAVIGYLVFLAVIGYLASMAVIGQPIVSLAVLRVVIGHHFERPVLFGLHYLVILHRTAVTQGGTDWQAGMLYKVWLSCSAPIGKLSLVTFPGRVEQPPRE